MSDGVFWPEFKAWLQAHGIDPDTEQVQSVAWEADCGFGPIRMHAYTLKRDADGKTMLDENGKPAVVERIVPMRHLPAVDVIRGQPARRHDA